ncbi:adenine phosphoribosyltransferase [Metarhizium guizhouense ARSEF 977]|uniref:adenine phosphoribosyltransferase n=1 Tax=Metarhizium guizhouense (strain ARSEF 977) TaxID=1276136 RepID=A0A0B4HBV4_METGA|nr:adenine phosphoribosyltransferase [Metarhizium guizhouense ARSEF 977]
MTGPPPLDHTSDLSSNIQTTAASTAQDAEGRQPAAAASSAAQLASAKISLRKTLRQFPDFPIPGIDFVDIMPLFANVDAHATLVSALELQITQTFNNVKPDIIVGLDARGFLFGPGLALSLGVGFAAVRKKGKLPGPCVTAEYVKEYGKDLFQMQQDAIKEGQKVLIVDDIIATGKLGQQLDQLLSLWKETYGITLGGSAKAAADLVTQLKGQVMGYLFILEVPGLNGRDKLGAAPTAILLEGV